MAITTHGHTIHRTSQTQAPMPDSSGACPAGYDSDGVGGCIAQIGYVASNCDAACMMSTDSCGFCWAATGDTFAHPQIGMYKWADCFNSDSTPADCPGLPVELTYQGLPQAGKPCVGGAGNSAHAVGDVLDGKPDVPGSSGNEIDQIYRIQSNIGNVAKDIAFEYHTFNGENWVQPYVVAPAGDISIRMRDGKARPSAADLQNAISPYNNVLPSFVKTFLQISNPRITAYACFESDWGG